MRAVFFAAISLVLLAACGTRQAQGPLVTEMRSPAGPGSEAPNLARGPDGRIFLTWIEPSGAHSRLLFSELGEAGWREPLEISRGSNWFVNWADIPSLIPLGDGRLAAHWLVRSGPGTYAYDIQVGLSEDDGQTWQALGRPHDDATETEHGFVSFYPYAASDGRDWPGLVWLDGRKMAAGPHAAHAHAGAGPESGMTLRHARLQPDGSFGEQVELDALACDCCQTAAVRVGDDVLLAYRDRSAEEIRDIRLQRRADGAWQDQDLLYADGWEISGCPVNGPALDASQERVAAAWFTGANGLPIVKAGMSHDAGRSFVYYELEAGGALGRVDVALLPEGAAVSWLSKEDQEATIRLQLIRGDESAADPPWPLLTTSVSRSSGFPRLVADGNALVLAWTDATSSPTQVRTARIRLQR